MNTIFAKVSKLSLSQQLIRILQTSSKQHSILSRAPALGLLTLCMLCESQHAYGYNLQAKSANNHVALCADNRPVIISGKGKIRQLRAPRRLHRKTCRNGSPVTTSSALSSQECALFDLSKDGVINGFDVIILGVAIKNRIKGFDLNADKRLRPNALDMQALLQKWNAICAPSDIDTGSGPLLPSATPTSVSTFSPTSTPESTTAPDATSTPQVNIPFSTATATASPSPTPTVISTPSYTFSATPPSTPTSTRTVTNTPTITPTMTNTATRTATSTPNPTVSATGIPECQENLQRSCGGGTNVGACEIGIQRCVGGNWGPCVGTVDPVIESCNGIDDDCDGQIDEEIPVRNAAEFNSMRSSEYISCTFTLSADIDFAGTCPNTEAPLELNGANHALLNLNCNQTRYGNGLFQTIFGTVRDLRIINATVLGCERSGILASVNYGTIQRVSVINGAVECPDSESSEFGPLYDSLGGLVGEMYGGIIEDSSVSSVTIRHINGRGLGGLVGTSFTRTILGSPPTIPIILNSRVVDSNIIGESCLGGLIGDSRDTTNITRGFAENISISGVQKIGGVLGRTGGGSILHKVYATGNLQGQTKIGGILGDLLTEPGFHQIFAPVYITQSFFRGLIDTASFPAVSFNYGERLPGLGGLVGSSREPLFLNDNYSWTQYSGQSEFGSLIGAIYDSSTFSADSNYTLSNIPYFIPNYYAHLTNIFSGNYTLDALGPRSLIPGVTGTLDANMRTPSTYTNAGWDQNIWRLRDGEYPRLHWE